jgi:hypothetical protein
MTKTETGPEDQDIDALTALLDLMTDFPSNEQRARFLLCCNWMRERGAAAAEHNAHELARVQAL